MMSMTCACTPEPRRLSVISGVPSRLSMGAMPTSASSSIVSWSSSVPLVNTWK